MCARCEWLMIARNVRYFSRRFALCRMRPRRSGEASGSVVPSATASGDPPDVAPLGGQRGAGDSAIHPDPTARVQAELDALPPKLRTSDVGQLIRVLQQLRETESCTPQLVAAVNKRLKEISAHAASPSEQKMAHDGMVKSVAWDPAGKYLATGCSDNTARVFDGKTGEEVLT